MHHRLRRFIAPVALLLACALAVVTAPAGAAGEAAVGLRAGPMVGYGEMREVMLWAQTTGPARVAVRYWPEGDRAAAQVTAEVETRAATAFTAKLLADRVEPGTRYVFELLLDGEPVVRPYPTSFETPPLWQWRGDPPRFTLAVGSCAYVNEEAYDRPGKPYGAEYGIFTSLARLAPDLMLWLGDNTYLREPDWGSRTGMLHRYSHTRALPELQPLLAATHHYAMWDDHDAGPNDTNRSQWNLPTAQEVFELFWANPSYGVQAAGGGLTTFFSWGDADFFLLDNRSHRSPNDRRSDQPTILGEAQLQWLLDALVTSRATFKIVTMGGQLLNPVEAHETYAHIAPGERRRLLALLRQEGVEGVVFLTGDRHHSEASRLPQRGGPTLYDFTFSPLTAGVHEAALLEDNPLRIDGTLVVERNFGWLELAGPWGQRTLTVQARGVDGEVLWEQVIDEAELQYPRDDGDGER